MRSVSHVLACIIAREAHEYTRETVRDIVVRPDDITEINTYEQLRDFDHHSEALQSEPSLPSADGNTVHSADSGAAS